MKKYEGLFQIGEVSALLNISRKMILNYEQNNLIHPVVVDEYSGYRYFDSFTIATIQLILDLRKAGMSIGEIEKYLKGRLSSNDQITKLKNQIAEMQIAIHQLEIRNKSENQAPVIKEIVIPECCCICRDVVAEDVNDAIKAVISTYDECLRRKLHLSGGYYHFCEFQRYLSDESYYELENINMKVCICIDPKDAPADAVNFKQTKALSASFCGNYDKGFSTYEALKAFIDKYHYKENGYPREFYLEGNFDNNFNKNIVWIIVPVA